MNPKQKQLIKIYAWKYWKKNWDNAYKFFNSKGNIKTKARYKKIWHDDFFKIFEDIEKELRKNG